MRKLPPAGGVQQTVCNPFTTRRLTHVQPERDCWDLRIDPRGGTSTQAGSFEYKKDGKMLWRGGLLSSVRPSMKSICLCGKCTEGHEPVMAAWGKWDSTDNWWEKKALGGRSRTEPGQRKQKYNSSNLQLVKHWTPLVHNKCQNVSCKKSLCGN